MAPGKLLSGSQRLAPPARFDGGSTAQSLGAIEQRLASRERELRIGFTRIAQRQVELELLLAALRRELQSCGTPLRSELLIRRPQQPDHAVLFADENRARVIVPAAMRTV